MGCSGDLLRSNGIEILAPMSSLDVFVPPELAFRRWLVLIACVGWVLAGVACAEPPVEAGNRYVGSQRCAACHAAIYSQWKKTRMANVVLDPRTHPEAVLGDFKNASPVRNFNLSDVALVYGSRWKQRYFTKRGNEYYVLPAQWDILHKRWLPFHVEKGADWWVADYPASNFARPTGPLCDGCHSVNYNLATHQVTEWNVGCERCHGPGGAHSDHPDKQNIVNPDKLDSVRANDTCIQCHSQGRPKANPIGGRYYDWPVGFVAGHRLANILRMETVHLGKTDFYYYPDGTAHKNRMQGNDFVSSVMYRHQVRCFDCHDVHSAQNPSNLIATGNALCLRCHGPDTEPGPHMSLTAHTHHAAGSPGSECIACHMPRIEQTLGDQNVASHTFRFISPAATKQYGIPNPCTTCHRDRSPDWALTQLASWQTVSPWRALRITH